MITKSKKAFVPAVLSAAVVLAGFRIALIISYMEKTSVDKNAYYLPDNPAVTAFTIAVVLCCIAAAVFAMVIEKGQNVEPITGGASSVVSLLCAFTFICQFAIYIVYRAYGLLSGGAMEIAVSVLMLLSGLLYFLRLGIRSDFGDDEKRARLALPALLTIAFFAVRLLNDFIQSNAAPMESSGAYHILSLVFSLLFFLTEGISFIRPVKTARLVVFGSTAVIFLIVYALPNLIVHGIGLLSFDYYAVASITDICLAGYICVRCAKTA